ncbi:probable disease resistance protein At4g27220 [Mangifera indica]|uniref:probable disease resistance protein At4g27220 n=1 Tax=Mangifera indica TaxID=29780 RepID=UPI001CFB36DF|nr:probable disease resistance protein At4g27220 [Mangifera indica]
MEIVTSAGGKVAEKVADNVFAAAGDQLGYLFHYNDNIERLKKQAEKLRDSRDMVLKKIEYAERNGEIIFDVVQKWLAEVDDISAKAEKFLEDEGKANKRCLKGWCINLRQHCRFSKEAKNHTLAISGQLQELGNLVSVSCPAPPSGIISSSEAFNSSIFESRNSFKKEVMEALIEDSNVNKIGICGMGGIGKTTLVKEIGHHVKEAREYDVVAMAVVSQTPDIMKIQGEIADMLGLKSLPTHSELERASSLWQKIKREKRVLIILDDVWEIIKLSEIGIPFGNDHRGCKILITSRSRDVCNGMDCQKIYTIATLSKQESWELFSKIAGPIVENSDINLIAREVTTKCGGLPLAIVTIAGALKGKNKHVWSNVAQQLRTSTPSSIPELERNVFLSLELSFKYLENETKSLFLFCSLFPEDYKIHVENLVRYWTGLRWFGHTHETIEIVRNRVHTIVSTITSSFLLIEEGEKYVKMHDVIRDFAIAIAPRYNHKFMVDVGLDLKEWPYGDTFEDFTCISLMTNYIQEIPNGLEYPNLQALLLQENKSLVVPSSFFEKMMNLKVLSLGRTYIKTLPDSLSFLTNLRTLDVRYSMLVDLSVIGRLSKLEIFSLSNSKLVKEIPSSFSQLTNLRLLDLNNIDIELIPCGVISSLQKLEELYVNRFVKWGSESCANLAELDVLSRLTSLHVFIPNNQVFSPTFLSFQKLPNFVLIIANSLLTKHKNLVHWTKSPTERYRSDKYLGNMLYSRIMEISSTNISMIYDKFRGSVKRTERLTLENIFNLDSISHDLTDEGFNELKYLDIKRCDKIRNLFNALERTTNSSFDNLEKLYLIENYNLIAICNGQPATQSFCKLKLLKVEKCNSLLNIAPSHLLLRFQNLQTLEVKMCRSLVYIFDCEKIKTGMRETKLLSSLENIHLEYLEEMLLIWKGDHQSISLHNLKRVYLWSCPKLIKLFSPTLLQSLICLEEIELNLCYNLKEIFEKEEVENVELDQTIIPPCLGNLTFIKISGCFNLEILFTPSIVKLLVKLKTLVIKRCLRIQEIITNEKGEKEEPLESIVFPSLYCLELGKLNSLTCFSSRSYTIEFPKLERLRIYKCRKMKTFGFGEQVTPNLKKVRLGGTNRWNGNLKSTLEEFFNEQAQKTAGRRTKNKRLLLQGDQIKVDSENGTSRGNDNLSTTLEELFDEQLLLVAALVVLEALADHEAEGLRE